MLLQVYWAILTLFYLYSWNCCLLMLKDRSFSRNWVKPTDIIGCLSERYIFYWSPIQSRKFFLWDWLRGWFSIWVSVTHKVSAMWDKSCLHSQERIVKFQSFPLWVFGKPTMREYFCIPLDLQVHPFWPSLIFDKCGNIVSGTQVLLITRMVRPLEAYSQLMSDF